MLKIKSTGQVSMIFAELELDQMRSRHIIEVMQIRISKGDKKAYDFHEVLNRLFFLQGDKHARGSVQPWHRFMISECASCCYTTYFSLALETESIISREQIQVSPLSAHRETLYNSSRTAHSSGCHPNGLCSSQKLRP